MLPTLLAFLALAAAPPADSWGGFRNDGTGRTAARLPLAWSPTDNLAWRVTTPGYGVGVRTSGMVSLRGLTVRRAATVRPGT